MQQPDLINGVIHQWSLNTFSRTGSGSVKGACAKELCVVKGIYLPLTGSDQALSWWLRPLMGAIETTYINLLKSWQASWG